jgi:ATP-dependent DNA ligase
MMAFRILARKDGAGVRLITRAGNDFSSRFPFIAMAVGNLPVRSCLIDGEAIVCDVNGLAVFDLIRGLGSKASAVLCALICLSLTGGIYAASRLRNANACSPSYYAGRTSALPSTKHFEEDGALVFGPACQLGCEGIVSKRLGSTYRRGRSPHWVKVKNPKAPAVKREAEEDWGR